MEKVGFALDTDGEWPPFATEHVWCEKTGTNYQLKNVPFFIRGLAFGDKFSAEPDPVNGCVFEFTVLESSGNSLVWIMEQDEVTFGQYEGELLGLGLSVHRFPGFGLYAVNVPAPVNGGAVDALMDRLEGLGFSMAFSVWRH